MPFPLFIHTLLLLVIEMSRPSRGDPNTRQKTYESYWTSVHDGKICAFDSPSQVLVSEDISRIRCALTCLSGTNCRGWNWKETSTCELFFFDPKVFVVSKNSCTFFSPAFNGCWNSPCQNVGSCLCRDHGYYCNCPEFLSTTNWALGRPAHVSTQYNTYSASLAVDGNNDTAMGHNSCAETAEGPGGENWWMVDLGRLISVVYVVLTNRGDSCCYTTANNFIVGVTNTSWSVSRPVRGGYPLCGQYPSALAAGSTVTQWCRVDTPPSQYVIIQQPASGGGYLIICELQVFGFEV